jgi:esterase/lipase superfamily enzyme
VKNTRQVLFASISTIGLLIGCAKPPQGEVEGARAALEDARVVEADKWAKDEYLKAEGSMKAFQGEIEIQNKRWFRDFERARVLGNQVRDEAEKAKKAAVINKESARTGSAIALESAAEALEAAEQAFRSVPKGKDTKADISLFGQDVADLASTFAEAQAAASTENFMEAQDKANSVEEKGNSIANQLTEANAKLNWARALPTLTPRGYNLINVFYGTDRNRTADKRPFAYFGMGRGGLSLGECSVSIPKSHRIGSLETPSAVLSLVLPKAARGMFENPSKQVLLLDVGTYDREQFRAALQKRFEFSKRREAFVFIHGYNVSFEDACRRTAQIAEDLKFSGAPMLYSWPSDGKKANYTRDENEVDWTAANLREFLRIIVMEGGIERLHLIAHSMGSRALVKALESAVRGNPAISASVVSNVVLMAPDIDKGVFLQIAEAIKTGCSRTTIYASSADKALIGSQFLHGYSRLGESGPGLTVLPGMDTVDASVVNTSLLGHSYYGDATSVIADLYELLIMNKPPQERFHLRARRRNGLTYWEFRPSRN